MTRLCPVSITITERIGISRRDISPDPGTRSSKDSRIITFLKCNVAGVIHRVYNVADRFGEIHRIYAVADRFSKFPLVSSPVIQSRITSKISIKTDLSNSFSPGSNLYSLNMHQGNIIEQIENIKVTFFMLS